MLAPHLTLQSANGHPSQEPERLEQGGHTQLGSEGESPQFGGEGGGGEHFHPPHGGLIEVSQSKPSGQSGGSGVGHFTE